ncbi:MAG: ferric reductase-like transmembrane domain-containing protein [Granulosicoccus sp.]
MSQSSTRSAQLAAIRYFAWPAICLAIAVPVIIAATSPLLAWREPVYIIAGFAGVLALALLLIQPLLVAGKLPGFLGLKGRRAHRWLGGALLATIIIHIAGLWITSPPDVVDALLFRSPTPFSLWGVIAMWAVLIAALMAALRRRLALPAHAWRRLHTALALVVVITSVIHVLQIDGTMGTNSKILLCALAIIATFGAIIQLRSWTMVKR